MVDSQNLSPEKTEPEQKDPPKHRFHSAGEIIHREITYRGVDWGLNSAFSVAFAFFVKRVEWGHKMWDATAGALSRATWGPFIKDETQLKNRVNDSKTFLSILAGGTVIIPIIMWLENKQHKKHMIEGLDRMIYGKDAVENDPKFAEEYKAIEQEPKKGFWIGMGARFLALAPMYTIMTHPVSGKWFNKDGGYYDHIATGTKAISKGLGIQPKSLMWDPNKEPVITEEIQKAIDIRTEREFGEDKFRTHWDFIHHMIGYDFGMTIFYSVLHEIAYNGLSHLSPKNRREHHAEKSDLPKPMVDVTPPAPLKVETPDAPAKADDKPQTKVGKIESQMTINHQPATRGVEAQA